MGPFNADFRHLLLTERFTSDCTSRGIPLTPNLDVTKFMVDEGTVGDWALQGLPSDDLSVSRRHLNRDGRPAHPRAGPRTRATVTRARPLNREESDPARRAE